MSDTRMDELVQTAREIEAELNKDGYSAQEVLFIATLLSQAASRAISGENEEIDEEIEEYEESEGEGSAPDKEEDSDYA